MHFRESEFRVDEWQQRNESVSLFARKELRLFVAFEQRIDLPKMKWIAGGIVNPQPLHAVALDRRGHIVNGSRAIGETHVENVGHVGLGRLVTPELVGSVKIVVRPQRLKGRKIRPQFFVERPECLLRFRKPIALRQVRLESGALLNISSKRGPRIGLRENLKAGDQWRGIASRRVVPRRGAM